MNAIGTLRQVNPVHVAAISAAIVLHLIGIGFLMSPMRLPTMPTMFPDIQVVFVDPAPKPTPPPPPQQVVRQEASHAVVSHISKPHAQTQVVDPTQSAVQSSQAQVANTQHTEVGPVDTRQSQVEASPKGLVVVKGSHPPYPPEALRSGVEGEVMLLVSVDAQGHPMDVSILKSSGNRLLDRSAQQHVLKHWLFLATGTPQSAKLPIRFSLQ